MADTYYPPVSFYFVVSFTGEGLDGETAETQFRSVSGLSVEFQTEALKEGGQNRFEHQLPTRTRYTPLVLKRGVLLGSKLIEWVMD
ncbi:MAG: phage tail protein, partial [Bacteroidota bacterium]